MKSNWKSSAVERVTIAVRRWPEGRLRSHVYNFVKAAVLVGFCSQLVSFLYHGSPIAGISKSFTLAVYMLALLAFCNLLFCKFGFCDFVARHFELIAL